MAGVLPFCATGNTSNKHEVLAHNRHDTIVVVFATGRYVRMQCTSTYSHAHTHAHGYMHTFTPLTVLLSLSFLIRNFAHSPVTGALSIPSFSGLMLLWSVLFRKNKAAALVRSSFVMLCACGGKLWQGR